METDYEWLKDHYDTFLGEKTAFWIELKRQSETLGYDSLIKEIVKLRARVSFYEDRIGTMGRDYKDFVRALDQSMKS